MLGNRTTSELLKTEQAVASGLHSVSITEQAMRLKSAMRLKRCGARAITKNHYEAHTGRTNSEHLLHRLQDLPTISSARPTQSLTGTSTGTTRVTSSRGTACVAEDSPICNITIWIPCGIEILSMGSTEVKMYSIWNTCDTENP